VEAKEKADNMKLFTEDLNDYRPWSGAVDTYNTIEEHDKLEELEQLIDEIYPDGISFTGLNDLLWFDSEFVFEQLGIQDEEEESEEE
jgi:hypothetical protein